MDRPSESESASGIGSEVGGGVGEARGWTRRSMIWDRRVSFLGRVFLSFFGPKEDDPRARAVAESVEPENFPELVRGSLPTQSGFKEWDYERILKNQQEYSYTYRPGNGASVLNAVAIFLGASLGKFFLHVASTTTCFDREKLTKHLVPPPFGVRDTKRGILTVMNHQSVIDDPLVLASFSPWWLPLRPSLARWGTCASDICFKGELREQYMRALKTLPVCRFIGLNQGWMDQLINYLCTGQWVNYYAEGRVSQKYIDRMRRGVGKIMCKAAENSGGLTVIPIYHEGLEDSMPLDEKNTLVYRVPRVGKRLWMIAGDPIQFEDLVKRSKTCRGEECLRIYEEAADRVGVAIHLLRSDLRKRAAKE
mmetsp:Transcript_26535/g.103353  ORF Transcript_26535/g.103353 Transcript_26535/m.103353 type:complete len:365 (-) Transcript_26535:1043-2137(-)